MPESAFRVVLLVAVALAITAAVRAPGPSGACRTELGVCARAGVPRCGLQLGDWRAGGARGTGLAADASHSACVRYAPDPRHDGDRDRGTALVSVVPQEVGVSGDTLVSRAAGSGEAQRARVTLHVAGSLPDHWAFAVAGTFLDRDTPHACAGLAVQPPVNAGYALIGGNWLRRPHGFYFERLADACVYDGQSAACPGEPSWIAHELVAGETLALDVALRRESDGWWLEAAVTAGEPPQPGIGQTAARHELGRMRQRVDEPCWLAPGAAGSALLVVIPDHGTAGPETRIDVSGFAWARADRPAR